MQFPLGLSKRQRKQNCVNGSDFTGLEFMGSRETVSKFMGSKGTGSELIASEFTELRETSSEFMGSTETQSSSGLEFTESKLVQSLGGQEKLFQSSRGRVLTVFASSDERVLYNY